MQVNEPTSLAGQIAEDPLSLDCPPVVKGKNLEHDCKSPNIPSST